ncbi:Fe-S cluster assembly protein SufB [bacterium]|nr:Fe-S cluster assembly protein SufB [bacterium]
MSLDRDKDQRESLNSLSNNYEYGYADEENYFYKSGKGLTPRLIVEMSRMKKEPEWMLNNRLKAYEMFKSKAMPNWGPDLSGVYFDDIHYYVRPQERNATDNWDDVPSYIRETYKKIGVKEAEQKRLIAGLTAQYDSEVVYHSIRSNLQSKGVIFLDMDSALREYPEIVKKYFGTIIPMSDNKFAALNTAVWSGGSFIYVPKGVRVDIPLQAYFRINAQAMGQFERTLIIADEGSFVHYVEGCTAPIYSRDSLHSAVVELIAMEGAKIRYSTIQNWSNNVYNLVTKRAFAYRNATVEWIDGNIGSKISMKYPAIYLMDEGAHGEVVSVAFAGKGQIQDTGAKIVHAASNTTSNVLSKSISQNGGQASYRGLVKVTPNVHNVRSNVRCDALLLDGISRSDTYPTMDVATPDVRVGHEATVSKIGDEQIFYLMSRGLSESDALTMIVNGFFEPFAKELPMEYAVELNRLIKLEMEGSVG